jgi:hypothetical protein
MNSHAKAATKMSAGHLGAKIGQYRIQESRFRTRAAAAADLLIRAELLETADKWRLLMEQASWLILELEPDSPSKYLN